MSVATYEVVGKRPSSLITTLAAMSFAKGKEPMNVNLSPALDCLRDEVHEKDEGQLEK